MPDTNGWPTETECLRKLDSTAPDDVDAILEAECAPILASVIAEFQSLPGKRGTGGTGRNFTPISETRYYDGLGYPELRVDDMVPGASLVVTCLGVTLTDVQAKRNHGALGTNILYRPVSGPGWEGECTLIPGAFPYGKMNIGVTTTWGFAAVVPADVYEAVRSEVVSRLLVQGFCDLAGAGETVKLAEFEANTAAGVSVWAQTSPIGVLHGLYTDCLTKYRDDGNWRRQRLVQRMS